MHYGIAVLVQDGTDLNEIMSSHREYYDAVDPETDEHFTPAYGGGIWDWWVEGGRWEGYFDGKNRISPADWLKMDWEKQKVPFGYIDHYGMYCAKEVYVPGGFPELWTGYLSQKQEWKARTSYFLPVPHFDQTFKLWVQEMSREHPKSQLVIVDIHR